MQILNPSIWTLAVCFLLCTPSGYATGRDTATVKINHLTMPTCYEKEIMAAMAHFPELNNTPIHFRLKHAYATLKTRPDLISMFRSKKHRTYIITISDQTIPALMPISFAHLPESARIGIIGHELSHVTDFSGKSEWNSLKTAIGHLSASYMDSLEFHTDSICIAHGLGIELKSWSSYIRDTMHIQYWRGADYVKKGASGHERYMNPETIDRVMNKQKTVQPQYPTITPSLK
jgi:hypothetical protein